MLASWLQALYLVVLFVSGLMNLGAALYIWGRRSAPAATYLLALQFATAHVAWCFFALALADSPEAAFFWARLRFAGLAPLGVFLLLYVLTITGRAHFITPRRLAPLLVIPFLTQLAVWLSPPDGSLFFREWHLVALDRVSLEATRFVGWYWVHVAYSYTLLAIAVVRLALFAWQSPAPYRQHFLVTLLSIVIGYAATAPGTLYRDALFLNPTPIGLSLMGVLVVWSLARYDPLGLLTIPSSTILAGVAEELVVMDPHHRILQVNPAAATLLGNLQPAFVGRPLSELFPAHKSPVAALLARGTGTLTLLLGPSGQERPYDIFLSPLHDPQGIKLGSLWMMRDATERQHMEDALRESEERLRSTLASLDDLVLVMDEVGRFVDAYQPALAADFSPLSAKCVGCFYRDVLPSSLVKQFDAAVTALLATEQVQAFDYSSRSGEEERWFNVKLSLRCTPEGSFAGTTVVVRNISHLKRAEQALLEFQERLKALQPFSAELARQPSLSAIVEQAIAWGQEELGFGLLSLTLTDAATLAYLDTQHGPLPLPSSKLAPGRWAEVLATPYRACLWDGDARLQTNWVAAAALWTGEELFGYVTTDNTLDGRLARPYELELLSLFGQTVGHALSLHVATQQLTHEATLLTTLIDAVPDQIFIKDTQGYYLKVNRAFARYRGFAEPAQMVGLTDQDFYALPLVQQIQEEDRFIVASGQPVTHREIQTLDPHNQAQWWEVVKQPLRVPNRQVQAILGVLHNITAARQIQDDLRQAREQAEAATAAKSRFLANMSHELRTPLNGVLGMTALLLDTPLSPTQQDFARTIQQSGEALLALISNILDFSALETDQLEIGHYPIELPRCLESVLDHVSGEASAKGLGLVYHPASDLPFSIVSDEVRLRQVLGNLLSNAVKFTNRGEVVLTASIHPTGPTAPDTPVYLEVSVEDTGIGITPERLERLFDPFTQADASFSRAHGGTGLGLALAQQLIERMGGLLEVASKVGRGSTFRVTLPVSALPDPPPPTLSSASSALAGRHLLLVGGSTRQRAAIRDMSERWGVHVHELVSDLTGVALPPQLDFALVDSLTHPSAQPLIEQLAAVCPLASLVSEVRPFTQLPPSFAYRLLKPITPAALQQGLLTLLPRQTTRLSEPEQGRLAERHPLRVLLAEDNVTNQKLALLALERLGYRAEVVWNGLEALAALDRGPYDVVLMDVQMPEMDGLNATRAIRKRSSPDQQPTIIALTANASAEDEAACLAAGMDGYLRKPLAFAALAATLQRVQRRPPGVPESTLTPLDLAALTQLQAILGEGGALLLDDLIRDFGSDAARLLTSARVAYQQAARGDLHRAAHSLKGISLTFGATTLAQLVAQIEQLARGDGSLDEVDSLLANAVAELERTKLALVAYRASQISS